MGNSINLIDRLLNKVTMYRLILYYLSALYSLTIIFSFFKVLPYSWVDLLTSGMYLIGVSYFVNQLIARIFKVKPNYESQLITGLILTLIVGPLSLFPNIIFLTLVSIIAMVSKYIVAYKKQHIFNPTAYAVTVTALIMGQGASWWIGDKVILPFIVLGGLLMAQKLRRFHLVLSFLVSYVLFLVLFNFNSLQISNLPILITSSIFSPVILFFTFVMLTEPITSPANRLMRIYFGISTGLIYVLYSVLLSNISYSLELALITSNLVFRILSFTEKYILVLRSKKEIADSIWEFIFEPTKRISFIPGQYLEWSLPHAHADSRGDRRYFTIASSPMENEVRLGVKIPDESSSFKKALKNLKLGDEVYATNLEGEFVLDKNNNTKYVFIAGGIGITPYMSIIQYMLDKKLTFDITLFYIAHSDSEFIHKKLFESAKANGVKVVYVVKERLNEEIIKKYVPDYESAMFYMSGPQPMIMAYEDLLQKIGNGTIKYKVDFFPGYDDQ